MGEACSSPGSNGPAQESPAARAETGPESALVHRGCLQEPGSRTTAASGHAGHPSASSLCSPLLIQRWHQPSAARDAPALHPALYPSGMENGDFIFQPSMRPYT